MRRRLLVALVLVSGLSIALFALPLAAVVREFYGNETVLSLERQASQAAVDVPPDYATSGDPVELPAPHPPTVVGLYNPGGHLVTGTGPALADNIVTSALGDGIADSRSGGDIAVAVPVTSGEAVIGATRVETSAAATDAKVHRAWALMAALATGVIALTTVAAWFLARRLSRPVHDLTVNLDRLGDGAFDLDTRPSGVSEIDRAQAAMVATADRLHEVLARERSFSAEASHQLRTPLASLRLAIETELAAPRNDPSIALQEALTDVDRLDATITALLALARSAVAPAAHVDLSRLAQDGADRWRGAFAANGRPLRFVPSRHATPIVARAAALEQALDVLLDNALKHGGAEVTLEVHRVTGGVEVSVRSEGPPISDPHTIWQNGDGQQRPRIGLNLARRLVEGEGGRLLLTESDPHPTFAILLAT